MHSGKLKNSLRTDKYENINSNFYVQDSNITHIQDFIELWDIKSCAYNIFGVEREKKKYENLNLKKIHNEID